MNAERTEYYHRKRDELERARQDALFVTEHYDEWYDEHPGWVVAVFDQRRVACAKELGDVIAQVESEGLDPGQVCIERLSSPDALEQAYRFVHSLHSVDRE